ncbi:MAG: hypothetical protein WC718_18540 [Phycisphaerales bacterium]
MSQKTRKSRRSNPQSTTADTGVGKFQKNSLTKEIFVDPQLERPLLLILHRGWVEARLLALGQKHQQLFELADAMEQLPWLVNNWKDEHLEAIRGNLKTYEDKYLGSRFDYLRYLDSDSPFSGS